MRRSAATIGSMLRARVHHPSESLPACSRRSSPCCRRGARRGDARCLRHVLERRARRGPLGGEGGSDAATVGEARSTARRCVLDFDAGDASTACAPLRQSHEDRDGRRPRRADAHRDREPRQRARPTHTTVTVTVSGRRLRADSRTLHVSVPAPRDVPFDDHLPAGGASAGHRSTGTLVLELERRLLRSSIPLERDGAARGRSVADPPGDPRSRRASACGTAPPPAGDSTSSRRRQPDCDGLRSRRRSVHRWRRSGTLVGGDREHPGHVERRSCPEGRPEAVRRRQSR